MVASVPLRSSGKKLGWSSCRGVRAFASQASSSGEDTAGAAAAARRPSTKGSREATKVITDITPHLAELDAERRASGGVDPKHVAAVFRILWEGHEHISEKGREGERLLRHIATLRGGNVEGYTDLIAALARLDRPEDCFAVFDRMKAVGVTPNAWTYTALISACVPRRDRPRAALLLEEMRTREDLRPDAVTYTLLLKANEGRSVAEVKEALQVLPQLKKAGVVPNLRLFDALINVISGNNFLEGKVGLNLDKQAMAEGKKYGAAGKRPKRENLHERAREQKEAQEMARAPRLELVLDVLEQMKEFDRLLSKSSANASASDEREPVSSLKANIFIFNSLFRAYELNGESQTDFEEAFAVFEEHMKLRPNRETYMTLLRIACKMRYRDQGERLLRKMKKAKASLWAAASEAEQAELERLKARVRRLPQSPESALQQQIAPNSQEHDDEPAEPVIDTTTV